MIPYREFEVVGENGNKVYIRVLRKLVHQYTGDTVRWCRIDYSDGSMDFTLLDEDDYENLLAMRVEPKEPETTQKDWEDFWHDMG